jgi:hypothetical protein
METEYIQHTYTTYDSVYADKVMEEINVLREERGFPATRIQSFQKSQSDGWGDLFTITYVNGYPAGITRDFDASF